MDIPDDLQRWFDTIIVSASDKTFYEQAFQQQLWGNIQVDKIHHPYIKKLLFYLIKPHRAIMYKAKIDGKTMQRPQNEPKKWVLPFSKPVRAIKHIHHSDHDPITIQDHQFTSSAWIQELERRQKKDGIAYTIEDVLDKDKIVAFLKTMTQDVENKIV